MTALQVIEKDTWEATLLSLMDTTEKNLIKLNTGNYKIFWETVEDTIELPYITMHHMMGGRLKNSTPHQYSDTQWKIVASTANMVTAQALVNAIAKLDKAMPVVPVAYGESCGYTYIEEIMPIFDRYVVQNIPLYIAGGIYRLRLNLGAN